MMELSGGTPAGIHDLSDDLIVEVLQFLGPDDGLCSSLCVSKQFYRCVTLWDEVLWRPHVEELWRECGWVYNVPTEVSVYSRVRRLTMAKLREKLKGYDVIRCIEKDDFCRHLVAYLAFKDVKSKCIRTVGMTTRHASSLRRFLPQWSLSMGEYRASLYYSKREIARKGISLDELCAAKWSFSFKYNEYEYEDDGARWESVFYPDYTLKTHMHNQMMRWQWVEDDSDGTIKIQVEHYPQLSSQRLPDGKWFLENMHVFFEQQDGFASNDETLLC